MSFEQEKQLEQTYLMPTYGRKPVEFVSGKGMTLVDDKGKEYLDFLASIGVTILGHSHPKLVQTIEQQAEKLLTVSNYYYIEGRGELAQTLSNMLNQTVPAAEQEPWQTFFANSGAEANECAIKLARLHAKKIADEQGKAPARLVVTLERSFHGRTLATLAATAQPAKQEAFQPLPDGFVATPANDVDALKALFDKMGDQICAVMLETVQGECGVYPCTKEFLQAARELTAAHGALLVLDEVQCGLYRCGTYPYAFQHFDIQPDVVTMAKAIAGGIPMGACSARTSVVAFEPGDHGSTFGGNNLAIAAANTVMETAVEEGLAANAEVVGAYLREKLQALPSVTEVRGLGLMVGADLDEGHDANEIVLKALEAGLVINATGPHTLRFLPPLICTKADVDTLIERLSALL